MENPVTWTELERTINEIVEHSQDKFTPIASLERHEVEELIAKNDPFDPASDLVENLQEREVIWIRRRSPEVGTSLAKRIAEELRAEGLVNEDVSN